MERINTENAKTVKELYLRNLSSEQSDYIQHLQVRFQKKTSTDAARLALFGYCKLDERYENVKKINTQLRGELRELETHLRHLKLTIKNYFQTEAKLLSTKEELEKVLEEKM